jgi:hypothetical protein
LLRRERNESEAEMLTVPVAGIPGG